MMALGQCWRSRLPMERAVVCLAGRRLLTSMAASIDCPSDKGDALPVPAIPFTRSNAPQRERWPRKEKDCFRVLSLDGGGFRGLVTARLIERLEEQVPGFLQSVDLVAGTSGGGILALLLSAGYGPRECQVLCRHAAEHVFRSSWARSLNPFTSRYSGVEKEEFLRTYLGDRRLVDLEKFALVTAVNLLQCIRTSHTQHYNRSWRPGVFSNLPHLPPPDPSPTLATKWEEEGGGLLAVHAAMRTSAAPIFFPIHQGFCDGGLLSSDPALIAYSKVRAHFPWVGAERIKVLSLGAGSIESFLDRGGPDKLEWGVVQWSSRLLRLLLHSGAVTSQSLLKDIMGAHPPTPFSNGPLATCGPLASGPLASSGAHHHHPPIANASASGGGVVSNYHRLDPVMRDEGVIAFDQVHRVGELLAMAEDVQLQDTVNFIRDSYMRT